MESTPVYLVDIDGTLANLSHRLRFIKCDKPDWDGFFAACPEKKGGDSPINEVIETVKLLKSAGAEIIMLSGRSEAVREQTLQWFTSHAVPCDALYLREEGDHRQDSIIKGEFLDDVFSKWGKSAIVGAFEDRQQVVDMYRERGLRVFQVAEGKF